MRVTQQMIDLALREVTGMLSEAAGKPVAVTLHRGNGNYKISNVLIVNGSNVWRDNAGGRTAADCYRALDVMRSLLGTVIDTREAERLRRGVMLLPEWDAETGRYGLSDCKHWDKPGTECAGPRVGITRDNVILCERHYNQTGA